MLYHRQQRHNTHTPALIKGWSYENTARNVQITENIFDRCAYRMLHLVCREEESLPVLRGNTYIQHMDGKIGQYGVNREQEPDNLDFDMRAEETITGSWGDSEAAVFGISRD